MTRARSDGAGATTGRRLTSLAAVLSVAITAGLVPIVARAKLDNDAARELAADICGSAGQRDGRLASSGAGMRGYQ